LAWLPIIELQFPELEELCRLLQIPIQNCGTVARATAYPSSERGEALLRTGNE
jgi:hypothetical protein